MGNEDKKREFSTSSILLYTVIGYVGSFVILIVTDMKFEWSRHIHADWFREVVAIVYAPLIWILQFIGIVTGRSL